MLVEARGPHTAWRRTGGGTHTATWCGGLVALLRLYFGLPVVTGKIGTWLFVWSNSENIYCVTVLKPKTAENRQLALWHLVNRLVPENAISVSKTCSNGYNMNMEHQKL